MDAIEARADRATGDMVCLSEAVASARDVRPLLAEVLRLRERCLQVAEILDKTSKGEWS